MKKLCKKTFFCIPIILLTVSCSNSQINTSEKLAEIKQHSWTELSSKYENLYLEDNMQNNISNEMLSEWWTILKDDTLAELIMLSLDNNKDLQKAKANVTEARAVLGINKAELLPWLDSSNNFERKKVSDNSPSEKTGVFNTYKLGIDASWEIDIFGGNRAKVEAAQKDLEAQYAELHAVWVSLTSEVVINYLSLRTLQERLSIAENNLKLQEDTVNLLQSKYNSKLIDELPLNQAKYTASQTEAIIPTIKINIEETLNRLAVLTGQLPGSLEKTLSEKKSLPDINEMIYVGIPADVLRQRPDIQMAEYKLEAQIARTKSAKADLKPKLILFGSIGLESYNSGSLLSTQSKGFSLTPQISFPIFHAGAIKNNIKVQSAKEEQYLAEYENTILNAVAEVRNALTSVSQENKKNFSLKEGVENAKLALKVTEDRYSNGLNDFESVLDAQRSLLSLQEQYVISQGQKISNLVGVFKALGGGWQPLFQQEKLSK